MAIRVLVASTQILVLASCATSPEPVRLRSNDGITWTDTELAAIRPPRPPKGDSPEVGYGRRLADINDPRYKPILPTKFNIDGRVYVGLFKVCVSHLGRVMSVSILQSTGEKQIDRTWISFIETWPYQPYSIRGTPVPFCHPARIEVRSQL